MPSGQSPGNAHKARTFIAVARQTACTRTGNTTYLRVELRPVIDGVVISIVGYAMVDGASVIGMPWLRKSVLIAYILQRLPG